MASPQLLWLATAQADPRNLWKQRQQNIAADWLKYAVDHSQSLATREATMDQVQAKSKHSARNPTWQYGVLRLNAESRGDFLGHLSSSGMRLPN